MNEQDRQRRRALVVFQIAVYGFLLAMFVIQLCMYAQRNW